MTSIPPSSGDRQRFGRPGSIRGEAAARGVSEYQVRRERAAERRGAPVGRIPWNKVEDKQAQSIRENLPRNRWRGAIEGVLRNYDHYSETSQKIGDYNYREQFLNSARSTEDDVDRWIENNGEESVNILFWYHQSSEKRRL